MPSQPQVYRAIIDDVIASVSVDFEEYGMDEDLLPLLQSVSTSERCRNQGELTPQKWENKLLMTKVAEFATRPDAEAGSSNQQAPPPAARPPPNASNGVEVKAEPDDALRLRGGAVRVG